MLTAEDFDPGFDYSYKVSKKKKCYFKKKYIQKKNADKKCYHLNYAGWVVYNK
jgi:hypothetical protein